MQNVYYDPAKFGLTPIAEIEYSSGCYEFDTRVVWKHDESGKFYTARDSGCSCPTPFEDIHGLSDLSDASLAFLRDEVQQQRDSEYTSYVSADQAASFIQSLRDAGVR